MDVQAAVSALSQGEKIKAGLIWTSQIIAMLQGLAGAERSGGLRVLKALCAMIGHEVTLARSITGDSAWEGVFPPLETALVMMESGVPEEANTHLSTALSRTTGILQRAMERLQAEGIGPDPGPRKHDGSDPETEPL